MKKINIKSIALILGAMIVLSGCDESSNNKNGAGASDPLELESEGKTFLFYSASTNEQYAYNVDSGKTINLQNSTDDAGHDISNFNMKASDSGRVFIWLDNKGDTLTSNDEEKVVMFTNDYSFTDDGNATWKDFYYLGHFHSNVNNNVTSYSLAAHNNSEFNTTSGGKYNALIRLNKYLAEQQLLEQKLSKSIPAAANGLCGFHTFISEQNKTFYYAMGKNGTMYIYDKNITTPALDSVVVTDSCTENEFGISSTEDGVLFFASNSMKVYSIDSHEDGIYHVHNSWNLSQLIGSGKSAQMMVALRAHRN